MFYILFKRIILFQFQFRFWSLCDIFQVSFSIFLLQLKIMLFSLQRLRCTFLSNPNVPTLLVILSYRIWYKVTLCVTSFKNILQIVKVCFIDLHRKSPAHSSLFLNKLSWRGLFNPQNVKNGTMAKTVRLIVHAINQTQIRVIEIRGNVTVKQDGKVQSVKLT